MKKSFIASVLMVMLSLTATVAAAGYVFWDDAGTADVLYRAAEQAAAVDVEQDEKEGGEGYYIAGYDGRVAVFRGSDRKEPIMIFEDVYLHSLPEYDRKRLDEGLYAGDHAELTSMIEDLTS